MYIPYVSRKIVEIKRKRERARRKRKAMICVGALGVLLFIASSIIMGVQIFERREKRRAARRKAMRERIRKRMAERTEKTNDSAECESCEAEMPHNVVE